MAERMKELSLRQIEKKLDEMEFSQSMPEQGWIKVIREALGMTVTQLADRIGVSRPTVSEYEERESEGTITLNSLRKAADGLACELVYALVPKENSLSNLREKTARQAAEKVVERTSQSMSLEDQDVGEEEKETQIEELKQEFLDEWDNSIWDVEKRDE